MSALKIAGLAALLGLNGCAHLNEAKNELQYGFLKGESFAHETQAVNTPNQMH